MGTAGASAQSAPAGHGHVLNRTAVARDAVEAMAEGAGTQTRSAGPEGDPGAFTYEWKTDRGPRYPS